MYQNGKKMYVTGAYMRLILCNKAKLRFLAHFVD